MNPEQQMAQIQQMMAERDEGEHVAPPILSEGTRTIQQAIGLQNIRLIYAVTAAQRYYSLRNKITLGLEVIPRNHTIDVEQKDSVDKKKTRMNFKSYIFGKLGEIHIDDKQFWQRVKEKYGTTSELLEILYHEMSVRLEPVWDEIAHEVKKISPGVIVDEESADMMDQIENTLAGTLLNDLEESLKGRV